MNTPSPCDKCIHLYYDCMKKDNPSDSAECKLGFNLGSDCWCFQEYKEKKLMKKTMDTVIDWMDKKFSDGCTQAMISRDDWTVLKNGVETLDNKLDAMYGSDDAYNEIMDKEENNNE